MKVVILNPFFYPQLAGIETVVYNHAKHLAARGHEVHVITSNLRYPTGFFKGVSRAEERDNFVIHRLAVLLRTPPVSRFLFAYPSNGGIIVPGLGNLIASLRPDVLHAHNIGAPAWAYSGAKYAVKHDKLFFYSPHMHFQGKLKLHRLRTLVFHGLNKLPLAAAHRIFHPTKVDFDLFPEEFPAVPRARFAVLPNGVDPPRFPRRRRSPDNRFNILFVGRVSDPRKGFDVLRVAMRHVFAASTREVMLTVVGDIAQAAREALAAEFGRLVRVLGQVSEDTLEKEYAAADLFVLPSWYEAFGLTYIEAMRYGVPVIGTAVGGIPEVVPEGTGLLVSPGSAPDLSKAILQLIDDKDSRLRMGAAGREWSRRFSWTQVVDALEAHYLQREP